MRTYLNRFHLCLIALVLIGGCSSGSKQADPSNYFLLDVPRQAVEGPGDTPVVLTVQSFPTAPGIDQQQLTYRRSTSRYETDYYDRFVADVGSQVAEQTRRWLSQSGCLGQVLPPGSSVDATHLLEGNITRLHADFRDKANAQAVMEIEFFLVDIRTRKPAVAYHGTYNATAPISEAKPESIIAAYNDCLEQILVKLERNLRQTDFAIEKESS